MSRATARDLCAAAYVDGYCVGAFNVTNILQMLAVVDAAVEKRSPVIIQTSVTPAKFLGPGVFSRVYDELAANAAVPMALQLDHCKDEALCRLCINRGYTSVMFDGSSFPWEENIALTRAVSDYAHKQGRCSVEGELGVVGGVEDEIAVSGEVDLCPPDRVAEFVERTQIDTMAPAIGTAHGVYKTANPFVDLHRFETVERNLNGRGLVAPLVVHGGTGLPNSTVRSLVDRGAAKFNVSTELKYVLIDTTAAYIGDHPQEYDPGALDRTVRKAIKERVGTWMDLLGSTNRVPGARPTAGKRR